MWIIICIARMMQPNSFSVTESCLYSRVTQFSKLFHEKSVLQLFRPIWTFKIKNVVAYVFFYKGKFSVVLWRALGGNLAAVYRCKYSYTIFGRQVQCGWFLHVYPIKKFQKRLVFVIDANSAICFCGDLLTCISWYKIRPENNWREQYNRSVLWIKLFLNTHEDT